MADESKVRSETVREPVDGEIVEPHITIGWDHRGRLCFGLHTPMPPILIAAELRRMAEVADRNVAFNRPEEPLIVGARGKVPRNGEGH